MHTQPKWFRSFHPTIWPDSEMAKFGFFVFFVFLGVQRKDEESRTAQRDRSRNRPRSARGNGGFHLVPAGLPSSRPLGALAVQPVQGLGLFRGENVFKLLGKWLRGGALAGRSRHVQQRDALVRVSSGLPRARRLEPVQHLSRGHCAAEHASPAPLRRERHHAGGGRALPSVLPRALELCAGRRRGAVPGVLRGWI